MRSYVAAFKRKNGRVVAVKLLAEDDEQAVDKADGVLTRIHKPSSPDEVECWELYNDKCEKVGICEAPFAGWD